MKKGLKIFAMVGIPIVIILGMFVSSYNNLVGLHENVNGGFSEVQNVLQRRADLIPGLVETVKGYASHEEETYIKLAEARSGVNSAGTPEELAEAEQNLNSSLDRLMVVVENYPELKANENFMSLQDELAGTENRISVERSNYNKDVGTYNSKVRRFPTNLIANIAGFEQAQYFEADADAQSAPEVNFSD